MSASEVMMREQLDRIIARTELRVEQHCSHASTLPPYGDQAKSARIQLAQMLAGLAKLKTCRNEFSEPQPRAASGTPGDHQTHNAYRNLPRLISTILAAAPANLSTFRGYLRPSATT